MKPLGLVSSGAPSLPAPSINSLWYHRKYYPAQEHPNGSFPQRPSGRSTTPPKTPQSTKIVSHYFLQGMFYQGECPTALSASGHQLHNWQDWLKKYHSCIFSPLKTMHDRTSCSMELQPVPWPGQMETRRLRQAGGNSKDSSHFILKFIFHFVSTQRCSKPGLRASFSPGRQKGTIGQPEHMAVGYAQCSRCNTSIVNYLE